MEEMYLNFQLSSRTRVQANAVALKTIITRTLQAALDCKCEFVSEDGETAAINQQISNCVKKLENLSSTLTLIARDFRSPNPFSARLNQIGRKKKLSAKDAATLREVEEIAARAPQLARIKRFSREAAGRAEIREARFFAGTRPQKFTVSGSLAAAGVGRFYCDASFCKLPRRVRARVFADVRDARSRDR